LSVCAFANLISI